MRRWILSLGLIALIALIGSLLFLRPVAHQVPAGAVARPAATLPAPAPTPPTPPATVTVAPSPAPIPAPAATESAAVPARAERTAPPPARHGRCPRFATEAWCLHGTIMAADDDLRDAYAAATRAGVDRDILVGIRSDWQSLRGRANRDPEALIRGYALLTQELHTEIRRVRQ